MLEITLSLGLTALIAYGSVLATNRFMKASGLSTSRLSASSKADLLTFTFAKVFLRKRQGGHPANYNCVYDATNSYCLMDCLPANSGENCRYLQILQSTGPAPGDTAELRIDHVCRALPARYTGVRFPQAECNICPNGQRSHIVINKYLPIGTEVNEVFHPVRNSSPAKQMIAAEMCFTRNVANKSLSAKINTWYLDQNSMQAFIIQKDFMLPDEIIDNPNIELQP